MTKPPGPELAEAIFAHPLLKRLCVMAAKQAAIDLTVVFPRASGWVQVSPNPSPVTPAFCRTIQRSKEGERHCRMCHILMAVAACTSKEATQQICHAGAFVLTVPMPSAKTGCHAVLSSCTFAGTDAHGKGTKRETVTARARKLGLDPATVRKAYDALPRLTEEKITAAREVMAAVAETVDLLVSHAEAQRETAELKRNRGARGHLRDTVENELRAYLPRTPGGPCPSGNRVGYVPPIVQVVTTLAREKPSMPFSVADIAAAARMSPNHFSSLFRKYQKRSFLEFLTEQRIELAKEVLGDLTLNIAEVARAVGYDDPGYFTRRFKQKVGVTPREWRVKRMA